jgi:hypothetical protein
VLAAILPAVLIRNNKSIIGRGTVSTKVDQMLRASLVPSKGLLSWLIRTKLLMTMNARTRLWDFIQFHSTGRIVQGNIVYREMMSTCLDEVCFGKN